MRLSQRWRASDVRRSPRRVNLILLVGPICGWLGAKDWNPPLVNIYAVTSILWFFFAVALFGWFLYLGITDKWRRYFVSDVTPGWFWFSVFWRCSASREPSTRDGRAAIDGVLVGCVASS